MELGKTLKIATYNLWNSSEFTSARVESILTELESLNADIIALQEVPTKMPLSKKPTFNYIADNIGFSYEVFLSYPSGADEGLAFLSKHPIESVDSSWEAIQDIEANQFALRVRVQIENMMLALTNVHLSSQPLPILVREEQIVATVRWINSLATEEAHELLLGDFNCYPQSSVHRFLCGHQSLSGESTFWHDLALVYCCQVKMEPEATLDFATNPRWWGSKTLELSGRFDWIMFRDCYPRPHPEILNVLTFGKRKHYSKENSPSDHYGVCALVKWQT